MLLMFKAKNYASFKDEAILDMRATSYKQHPTHVISVNDDVKLLKTTALYGANASGKSNFISAMFFFEQYILSQFINQRNDNGIEPMNQHFKKNTEPFQLSSEKNAVSEFEIIFLRNNKQLQYGFECTEEEIVSEWYYIDDKKVFERDGTNLSFGSQYQKYLGEYKKVPKERIYLAVLEYFLEDEAKKMILNDFVDFFADEYHIFVELLLESAVKGIAGMVGIKDRLISDSDFRNQVEYYLKQIDVGIERIDVREVTILDEVTGKERKENIVRTVHNVYDDDGKVAAEEFFELQKESSGTLRFFAYIQSIIEMMESGGVFIVDEMSAKLHPLLTKLIVDIFQSKQNTKAQLIFTTHDISLLNNNQFRRDEVVFVDKNSRGESSLYALSDLKIREDASFNKDYLQGKYGAIPIFDYDAIMGRD